MRYYHYVETARCFCIDHEIWWLIKGTVSRYSYAPEKHPGFHDDNQITDMQNGASTVYWIQDQNVNGWSTVLQLTKGSHENIMQKSDVHCRRGEIKYWPRTLRIHGWSTKITVWVTGQCQEINRQQSIQYLVHRKKKVSDIPVPSRDVTYQTLPGREKFNLSFQGRVW